MERKKHIIKLEQRELIENIRDFEQSALSELYQKAYGIISDIISDEDHLKKMEDGKEAVKRVRKETGNLLAFLGERGSGKTTAMLSFLNSLSSEGAKKRLNKNVDFITFDSVDASMLEKEEDLFEIILANMLMKLMKYEQENEAYRINSRELFRDEPVKKNEIQRKFEEIYRNLQNMKRKNEDDIYNSPLSSLRSLSVSGMLKNDFAKLVQQYIKIFNSGKEQFTQNTYLVFAIDDLDMNIENGFEMLGEIHRYLLVPNVIVLITAKYEQLEILGNSSFSRMFEDLHREMDDWKVAYLNQTAREYLEKMIPIYHRLYLPSLTNEISRFSEQLYISKENVIAKKAILGKIGRRIGVYFDGSKHGKHYLEPVSLRGLNDYYCFLNELPHLRDEENGYHEIELERLLYNYDKFINDICNRYVVERLQVEEKRVFERLMQVPQEIWIPYLHKQLSELEVPYKKMEFEIFMTDTQIGFGNVLLFLSLLSRVSEEKKNLAQCIIIMFSLVLNREMYELAFNDKSMREGERRVRDGILQGSWIGAWADRIFPNLLVMNQDKDTLRGDRILSVWHLSKVRFLDAILECDVKRIPTAKGLVSWMVSHRKIMKSLEMLLFFMEEFYDVQGREEELRLVFRIIENADKASYKLQIRIANAKVDFNILAFLKNSYYYAERLHEIHTAIFRGFFDYLKSDAYQNIGSYIRQYRAQETLLFAKYEQWDSKYRKYLNGMPLPVQHVDIWKNMLEDLSAWSAQYFERENPLKNAWYYLEEVCVHMEEYMKNVEDAYGDLDIQLSQTFRNCPVIECIYDYRMSGLLDSFPKLFYELLIKCNKFNAEESRTHMQDQVQATTDPDWIDIL